MGKPAGKGFTVFTKASCARLRELGCLPPASPFLILASSVDFSRLLGPGKAAPSAPGAGPKGLVAAPGLLASWYWGRGEGGAARAFFCACAMGSERVGARAR